MLKPFLILTTVSLLASCGSHHLHSEKEREMTVGIVQKEIRQGMSQGEVASALGSPNIVTKDQNGSQTWIYDKIASEVSYSNDHGGFWLILGGYQKVEDPALRPKKT